MLVVLVLRGLNDPRLERVKRGVGGTKLVGLDSQPRDDNSAYQSIADLEREGDVDVLQLRVLDVRDLMGSISSCSSFAMQTAGPLQLVAIKLQL